MPLWSNTKSPTWVPTANGQAYNVFPEKYGWVLRHYKGNNNYWDETLCIKENILEASAANIVAVAFLTHTNYSSFTVTSGVGNAVTYQYSLQNATSGNVFQMSNSSVFNALGTISPTSNVVPYTQYSITNNVGTFNNSLGTVFTSNGSQNVSTGFTYLANSSVVRVWTSNATGTPVTNSQLFTNAAINTNNAAAFPLGSLVFQSNGTANLATGFVFRANSTTMMLGNVSGQFVSNSTQNTLVLSTNNQVNVTTTAVATEYKTLVASASNSQVNAVVTAVSSNVEGTLLVNRTSGRYTTANVLQNGFANLTVSAANNFANGTVGVFYDERVTVSGGTPTLVVSSNGTTNATASFASGNNTNRLVFTYTANAAAAANLYVEGQTLGGTGTITDQANASVSANITFATNKVANAYFGASGANVTV
jgi:hypothetical protein